MWKSEQRACFTSAECLWRRESFSPIARLLGHSPGARCGTPLTPCHLLLSLSSPMVSLLVFCLLSPPHLTYPIIFVSLLLSLPSFLSFSQIPSLLGQIHHYEYIHLHLPNILLFHEVFPAPSIRCKHFLLRTLTAL